MEFLLYKNGNSFLFTHLFFGLINNYFKVYFFKEVVKYNIKQMEIQIISGINMHARFINLGNLIICLCQELCHASVLTWVGV